MSEAPDRRDDDPLADEQADAAANEAGRIGGRDPQPDVDPAERPVAEGGGGVAEGFEQAEEQVERTSSHDERRVPSPLQHQGEPEETAGERIGAEYGDADDADSTEDAEPHEG